MNKPRTRASAPPAWREGHVRPRRSSSRRHPTVTAVAVFVGVTLAAIGLLAFGTGTSLALGGGIDWVANGVSVEMTNSGEVDAVIFGDREDINSDEILLQYEGFNEQDREVNISVEVRGEDDGDSTGWNGGGTTETGWEPLAEDTVTVANLSDSLSLSWAEVFGEDRPVDITGEHSEIQTDDFEAADIGETRSRQLGVRIRAEAPDEGVSDQKTTTADVITTRVGADINFEIESTDTPEGFVPDTGNAFGDRNGLTYGWEFENEEARERNSDPDTKNDTLIHFADDSIPEEYDSDIHPFWSIELPNGTYNVTFVAGDPDSTDSEHTFEVNGKLFQDPENDGGTSRSSNFVRYEGQVTVSDGTMMFEPPDGVYNPKLNWVRIRTTDITEPFFDVEIDDTNAPRAVGETLLVNYTVTNTGLEADTQDVNLAVDGDGADTDEQSLGEGETATGTLEWNVDRSGEVELNVSTDDSSDTETVVVGDAFFDVEITGTNSPQELGETIEVEYEVENTGATTDSQNVRLEVDGDTVDIEAVELNASETATGTLEWNTTGEQEGDYDANVSTDDSLDTVEVTVGLSDGPFYDVEITDAPIDAGVGDNITVEAEVQNTGDETGLQDIEFLVNGTVEAVEDNVGLMPGNSTNTTFEYMVGENDTPAIEVEVSSDNDSDTKTVSINEPEFFEVDIDDDQTDDTVSETENVTVVADINNTGGMGEQEILFTVEDNDGTEIFTDTQNLSLGAGAADSVTFEYETQAGDEPEIDVTVASDNDSDTRTVTVERQGTYAFNINNSRDEETNITGIGIRNTTEGEAVQVGDGMDAVDGVLIRDGAAQLIPTGVTVPIDSTEPDDADIVSGDDFQETPLQPDEETEFEFERFRDEDGVPVDMDGEGFVVEIEIENDFTGVFEIENQGDTVFLNEIQAGAVALTPDVKSTGNSGKYEYGLNNTGDIDVTVVGIGVRSTTAQDVVRVEEGGFFREGDRIIDANTDIPIDSTTIVQHDPVDILTDEPEVVFEFDRFVEEDGSNGRMNDEEVVIEVEFDDGSTRTYDLVP